MAECDGFGRISRSTRPKQRVGIRTDPPKVSIRPSLKGWCRESAATPLASERQSCAAEALRSRWIAGSPCGAVERPRCSSASHPDATSRADLVEVRFELHFVTGRSAGLGGHRHDP
jgi:hypothetical protein